jgi:DNA recombination protein Rad52
MAGAQDKYGRSSQSDKQLDSNDVAALLAKNLGPEWISKGSGSNAVEHLKYNDLVIIMNEVFGVHGWSSSITSVDREFLEEVSDPNKEGSTLWSACVRVQCRITLGKDGNYREAIGCGDENFCRTKSGAIMRAIKGAETDAFKRVCRLFGNVTGGCLSDLTYMERIGAVEYEREDPCADENLFRKPRVGVKRRRVNDSTLRLPTNGGKNISYRPVID